MGAAARAPHSTRFTVDGRWERSKRQLRPALCLLLPVLLLAVQAGHRLRRLLPCMTMMTTMTLIPITMPPPMQMMMRRKTRLAATARQPALRRQAATESAGIVIAVVSGNFADTAVMAGSAWEWARVTLALE